MDPSLTPSEQLLRSLPRVDSLLEAPLACDLIDRCGREEVRHVIRLTLDDLRAQLRKNSGECAAAADLASPEGLLEQVQTRLAARARPLVHRVLNATGIILHTGLGRALLPPAALQALQREHGGYSLLAVSRQTGARRRREAGAVQILRELTGAEDGTVVNNNAAATIIALTTLAAGREVIVSRGELVEIGGSFRLPDVMKMSGARLVEVGTTNRTYLRDYEEAVTPETALLLAVHTSNYKIMGFSEAVPLEDLVALGRRLELPVMHDLGSGCLVELGTFGAGEEPLVQDSLYKGADLVCFSGDKLLGGPQAGLLLGNQELIDRIRKHPLFRAFRVDKLTLTALEATLHLFRDPGRLAKTHPTLQMIQATPEALRARARSLADRIARATQVHVEVVPETSQLGGGSLPGHDLPTHVVALSATGFSAEELALQLRLGEPAVFARVKKDNVMLDPRTLRLQDEDDLVSTITTALSAR